MSDEWRKLSNGNWVMKNLHPNSLLMLNRNVKSTTTLEILLYPNSCQRENQWGGREKEMDLERERERCWMDLERVAEKMDYKFEGNGFSSLFPTKQWKESK